MSLAEAGISIDKKWVVDLARSLTYRMCSRSGELIRFADYEEIKGVALAKWGRAAATLRWRRICHNGWWSDEKIHLRTLFPLFVHAEYNIHGISKDYWTEARQ